jgi:hypothetical protein
VSTDPWHVPDADEERRALWQQMNPRWHFTPPWYSPDRQWHARCGSYDAAAGTLGRLMDQLVEDEPLEDLPELLAIVRPRGNPVRSFLPGDLQYPNHDHVHHD